MRVFHWAARRLAFAAAWYSGGIWDQPHLAAGYTACWLLIVARIVWGFVGSRYARFSDFTYGPRVTLRYLARHGAHARSTLPGTQSGWGAPW